MSHAANTLSNVDHFKVISEPKLTIDEADKNMRKLVMMPVKQ